MSLELNAKPNFAAAPEVTELCCESLTELRNLKLSRQSDFRNPSSTVASYEEDSPPLRFEVREKFEQTHNPGPDSARTRQTKAYASSADDPSPSAVSPAVVPDKQTQTWPSKANVAYADEPNPSAVLFKSPAVVPDKQTQTWPSKANVSYADEPNPSAVPLKSPAVVPDKQTQTWPSKANVSYADEPDPSAVLLKSPAVVPDKQTQTWPSKANVSYADEPNPSAVLLKSPVVVPDKQTQTWPTKANVSYADEPNPSAVLLKNPVVVPDKQTQTWPTKANVSYADEPDPSAVLLKSPAVVPDKQIQTWPTKANVSYADEPNPSAVLLKSPAVVPDKQTQTWPTKANVSYADEPNPSAVLLKSPAVVPDKQTQTWPTKANVSYADEPNPSAVLFKSLAVVPDKQIQTWATRAYADEPSPAAPRIKAQLVPEIEAVTRTTESLFGSPAIVVATKGTNATALQGDTVLTAPLRSTQSELVGSVSVKQLLLDNSAEGVRSAAMLQIRLDSGSKTGVQDSAATLAKESSSILPRIDIFGLNDGQHWLYKSGAGANIVDETRSSAVQNADRILAQGRQANGLFLTRQNGDESYSSAYNALGSFSMVQKSNSIVLSDHKVEGISSVILITETLTGAYNARQSFTAPQKADGNLATAQNPSDTSSAAQNLDRRFAATLNTDAIPAVLQKMNTSISAEHKADGASSAQSQNATFSASLKPNSTYSVAQDLDRLSSLLQRANGIAAAAPTSDRSVSLPQKTDLIFAAVYSTDRLSSTVTRANATVSPAPETNRNFSPQQRSDYVPAREQSTDRPPSLSQNADKVSSQAETPNRGIPAGQKSDQVASIEQTINQIHINSGMSLGAPNESAQVRVVQPATSPLHEIEGDGENDDDAEPDVDRLDESTERFPAEFLELPGLRNVMGISEIFKFIDKAAEKQDPDKNANPSPPVPQHRTRYRVQHEDTLESIALLKLKDPRFADLLVTINRAEIHFVERDGIEVPAVYPQQIIWLPSAEEVEIFKKHFFNNKKQSKLHSSSSTNPTPILYDFNPPTATVQGLEQSECAPQPRIASRAMTSVLKIVRASDHSVQGADSRIPMIIDSLPVAMIITNSAGMVETINLKTEQMFGYRGADIIAQHISQLLSLSNACSPEQFMENLNQQWLDRVTELEAIKADSVRFPVEVSITKFCYRGTERFLTIALDVTERHELEQFKKDLMADVSHDLRTPLTSLQCALSLFRMDAFGIINEEGKNTLNKAELELNRLMSLVDGLLDLEKMQTGKMQLDREVLDLHKLVSNSVNAVTYIADKHDLKISIPSAGLEAFGDESKLSQVIVNLLSNAIKFSPNGSHISVSYEELQDWVMVKVKDQGVGIEAAHHNAIFERFQQIQSTDNSEKGGKGLGLAICKAIVEAHGGVIGVESEQHKGSTFWFKIPQPV